MFRAIRTMHSLFSSGIYSESIQRTNYNSTFSFCHADIYIFRMSGEHGEPWRTHLFSMIFTGFWTQNEGGIRSTGSISGHSHSIFRHGEIKTRNYNWLYGYFHYKSQSKIKNVSSWLLKTLANEFTENSKSKIFHYLKQLKKSTFQKFEIYKYHNFSRMHNIKNLN